MKRNRNNEFDMRELAYGSPNMCSWYQSWYGFDNINPHNAVIGDNHCNTHGNIAATLKTYIIDNSK